MRALPEWAGPRRLPRIPAHKVVLASGLTIVLVERRDLPMVDVEIVIRSGAEFDTPARAGHFSMLAEMLDEGTVSRSAVQIAEEIDYLGAYLNIQAGWDSTVLSTRVLSARLLPALDIVAEMFSAVTFPLDEFRRKKEERINALMQEHDEAALVATKALARAVFGDSHPYGAPIDGTVASVSAMKHAEPHALYDQHVAPNNMFILAVGDVDAGSMADELADRFNDRKVVRPPPPPNLPAEPARARHVVLVDKPGAAQSEVRVGHKAPARDTADYFPIMVMNTILGGAFTSRLNMILRERMAVTYGASSRFRLRRSGGLFTAGAAILTEAAARSARVIADEMSRLQSESVGAEELRRAQSYIAYGLPRSFETTEDIAAHLREQVLYGLADDYWETYVERIFDVTAEDVRNAAARHLHPEHCAVVVVADRAEVESELRGASLGELAPMEVQT